MRTRSCHLLVGECVRSNFEYTYQFCCARMEKKAEMEKTTIPYDTISTQSESTESAFDKCCFVISMRTGCFILGYLNLVINSYETLVLLGITTFFGLVTHGFDHFDTNSTTSAVFDDQGTDDKLVLNRIAIILFMIIVFNILWLTLNIACLVGLHMKRVYAIKCYIGFASVRLALSLASLIHLVIVNKTTTQYVLTHSFNIALSAYFIHIFYSYMVQLTREKKMAEFPQIVVAKEFCKQPSKF